MVVVGWMVARMMVVEGMVVRTVELRMVVVVGMMGVVKKISESRELRRAV